MIYLIIHIPNYLHSFLRTLVNFCLVIIMFFHVITVTSYKRHGVGIQLDDVQQPVQTN